MIETEELEIKLPKCFKDSVFTKEEIKFIISVMSEFGEQDVENSIKKISSGKDFINSDISVLDQIEISSIILNKVFKEKMWKV